MFRLPITTHFDKASFHPETLSSILLSIHVCLRRPRLYIYGSIQLKYVCNAFLSHALYTIVAENLYIFVVYHSFLYSFFSPFFFVYLRSSLCNCIKQSTTDHGLQTILRNNLFQWLTVPCFKRIFASTMCELMFQCVRGYEGG